MSFSIHVSTRAIHSVHRSVNLLKRFTLGGMTNIIAHSIDSFVFILDTLCNFNTFIDI